MHGLWRLCALLDFVRLDRVDRVPAGVEHLLVAQSVEDSIAAQHDEVMEVRSYSELRDLRLRDDDAFFASILGILGLDVAERAGD